MIVGLLAFGLVAAAVLVGLLPWWLIGDEGYRCASATTFPGCVEQGAKIVNQPALDAARASTRTSFGLVSGAVLAGAAAVIGVVVSNHNAALTREALDATVEANNATKKRDQDTAERERERAGDDRYTAAIDQLGNPSASVRLGAMHSLHRLAESDPGRMPTVVDVLCAYLRQPFHHPAHDWNPSEHEEGAQPPPRAWWPASQKERDERDSEREVRATATRLMPDLLPLASTPPQSGDRLPPLEINLNGAVLDELNFFGRRTGPVRLNGAHITGDLRLTGGTHIDGGLMLSLGAHIDGDLLLGVSTYIDGTLRLDSGARVTGDLRLDSGACVTGDLLLNDGAHIDGNLWLDDARIDSDVQLNDGARVDGSLRLMRNTRINGDLQLGQDVRIGGEVVRDDDARISGDVRYNESAHIGRSSSLFTNTDV